ncbi:MAG: GGDEF domain-containing protein [Steroidobacteraceae bacterium]
MHEPDAREDTTATVAVMLRVLPPPHALLAIRSPETRKHFEQRIHKEMLDVALCEEQQAIEQLSEQFRAVVITDNLPLIRRIRTQKLPRDPFILYIAPNDDLEEIEAGLFAGADDCLARHAGEPLLKARLGTARRIAELEEVLRIALIENRELSTTDELTRVASRRFFGKHFPREIDRAARYRRPLSLILCDIDFFKNVNDTLGHAGGDEVLRQFGTRLQESLRRGIDWVARLGGEEFAVILPETNYDQALDAARRLRACVADRPFQVPGNTVEVTASFGMCNLQQVPFGERKTADHMLRIADAALYRSKHAGRNRVTATLMPMNPVRRDGNEIDRMLSP